MKLCNGLIHLSCRNLDEFDRKKEMKILLCNEAFIGDLILSTSVFPILKKFYPGCKIGFLTGSWAKEVVEDHIHLDWVHTYDQVIFNRSKMPKQKKKLIEILSKKKALKEVQEIKYDLAIDLHSYYSENSAHFIFKSNIPRRVAFWTCRKPFFYNEILFWHCKNLHMLENHKRMLFEMGIPDCNLEGFRPTLEYRHPIELNEHHAKLPKKYILVHVGTGELGREWEVNSWIELLCKLGRAPLVFIGKGKREKERIKKIAKNLPFAFDFSDCFTWKELIPVIKNASFLIGLESMAGHMAAAFNIPALLIYAGESYVNWEPYNPNCHVIKPAEIYWHEKESLFPKEPIHMITADEVYDKLERLLDRYQIRTSFM